MRRSMSFTQGAALNHSNNLKDKGITKVTRAEVDAWWAAKAPELLAEAKERLAKAEEVVKEVENTIAAFPAKTGVTIRGAANLALKNALTALALVKGEVTSLTPALPIAIGTTGGEGVAPELTSEEKIAAAQKALDDALTAQKAAVDAKANLGTEATAKEKGDATRAVNKANAAVAEAQVALDTLNP